MKESRKRALVFSWAGAALVLAILAMINVVAHYLYLRVDRSAGRIYSVSSGTKKILGDLKDNLVIKVFYTPRLPPPYGLNEQYLKALLGEYKSASSGKIRLEFLDPNTDEEASREAMAAGVQAVRLSVMARDKFEMKEAYMGLAMLYRGKTEAIPLVQNAADFEYDITRKIRKLIGADLKNVGFVTGHGERSEKNPALRPVFNALKETMDISEVDLAKPVPAQLDALWILGPRQEFSPHDLERLKAWVGVGKSLGVLLDRRQVELRRFISSEVPTKGLAALLREWGLDVRDGFVVDRQCERIQLERQNGMFVMMNVIDYAYIPVVTSFSQGHPATRGLDAISVPFVHPVSFSTGAAAGLRYTPLMHSSPSSWYVTKSQISPYEKIAGLDKAEKGPFTLAGIVEGDFYKATPSTYTATDALPAGNPAGGEAPRGAPGRLVVLGTSRIIHPGLSIKPGNVTLLQNLVEWSLQDDSMLSIRSKGISFRYIKQLSNAKRILAKNALIFALPLLVLLAGLAVYQAQRARRRKLPAIYGT